LADGDDETSVGNGASINQSVSVFIKEAIGKKT
jgi:hypothetical protein